VDSNRRQRSALAAKGEESGRGNAARVEGFMRCGGIENGDFCNYAVAAATHFQMPS
jgi:hypothetical protein